MLPSPPHTHPTPHPCCAVSEAPKEAPAVHKFASYNPDIKTDDQKKEEVIQ